MYQLEERILFDGAAAVDLAAAQQEQQAQEAQAQTQPQAQPQTDTAAPGAQTQTVTPDKTAPALPVDTHSAVPTTDAASADHSTASLSAPIDASNPSQSSDTHHVNVLVVSDSLENADELFKSANTDTIVVRYNEKATTGAELLKEITDALHGEKADSIGFVTDKAHDGAVRIFSDSDTSGKTLSTETQQKFWNGVEGLLSEKGKVNIFSSDLASTAEGRHLVDSLSQITNHQVAASTDITGDKDAGGNWELEYVSRGSGSVDLIEEYFNRESIQSFDHRIENPTEIAFIDTSVKDVSTIVSQLDKDVEVIYLTKDNAFNEITGYLKGRTDVDSIHIISDADYTTGGFFLGKDTVNADFIASHQNELAAWGKSMSADGDIHIYGCNVAKDQVGKDLVNQIATATGADVAASTDVTGLAGNWNLEYSTGSVETHDFIINDYYHNLNTFTVRRLDDYMVTNPYGVNPANLTFREAILISVNGDNIVFADYTILHSKTSSTPDPNTDWPTAGHIFIAPYVYHGDTGAVNHAGGYALGTTTITVSGFDGNILVGSSISFAGDTNFYKVKTVNAGTTTTTITLSTGLVNSIANNTAITGYVQGLVDTLTIKANVTIDGNIVTPSWTEGIVVHPVVNSPVILDARNSFRGMYIDTLMNADQTGVSLESMVITNGLSLSTDLVSPAGGNGGGVFISSVSAVSMGGKVSVSNSHATYGGGIYNAGNLKMNGDVFENIANDGSGVGNGGGIYNVGLLTSTAGEIYDNSAAEHGGGIYNDGTMDLAGGGPQSTVNVGCHRVTGFLVDGPNHAGGNGGGIYSNNGDVSMEYVNVRNNTAVDNGGGIYIFSNYEQSTPMHFTFVELVSNTAGIDGGGLYLTNANSTSTANVFELEWSDVVGNAATGNGGGICFFNNAGNILIATSITPNTSYNTESEIVGNTALNGAGVYIENCVNVTMDFMNMSGNQASANGGAIYVKDSGTVTLTDMEIASNWADVNGGGIYYTNATSGSLNVKTSNISNNIAIGNGAGIYQANGALSVENSTLSKNIAIGNGGAIYMNYGMLDVNFATLAYNEGFGYGAAIYIAGDPVNMSALTVTNSIIYNLNADFFTSQIYIPLAANINASGFSTDNNIYSHYFQDLTSNPAGHSLALTISTDPFIARLYGTNQAASDLLQANLYLDTELLYHANYRTMALAIMSSDSWAYNATSAGLIARDQRGNTRSTGLEWTWDSVNHTWISTDKTKTAIGAFDPIFHTEVTSKGDDSQLWYTADQNAHYYSIAGANGLTLREAIYWIDTRANALPAEYDTRYVGFDKTLFGTAGDGAVYDNTIQLNYGQIEMGGRWGNWDSSSSHRDVAVGYMIRNPDNTGNLLHHDNTLRAIDDPSRITVLAGNSGNATAVNRLFMNSDDSVLALNNLTLSGGAPQISVGQYGLSKDGGSIYNEATITLINMVVQNATAAGGNLASNYGGKGGGIYNEGTAYIYDSSILNNTATSIRSDPNDKSPDAGQGGGIWNGYGGSMTIDRTRISGNTVNGASDSGNAMLGGGIYNASTLTITRSEISGNKATGSTIDQNAVKGAGIYNNSNFYMANCTVAENTLDTGGVKIDYTKVDSAGKPIYKWGSYASAIYNNGTMVTYYNTMANNRALVSDSSFWNAETLKARNLESMAAFYNADGASLSLANSILVENIAILTVSGNTVWQKSDIYVRTGTDINTAGDNGKYNIIGAYNTPRTEQSYVYYAPSTKDLPTPNVPVYYELTYTGANPVWTPIYEFVAFINGPAVNTGFDWGNLVPSTPELHNTVGFFNLLPASGAPTYLTLAPTTSDFLLLHPLDPQYAGITAPFIYTQKLLADGTPVPGVYIKVTGFDPATGKATVTEINTNDNGGNVANPTAGLYVSIGGAQYSFNAANAAYSNDLSSGSKPAPITVILEEGHTPLDPGFIPDTSNLRYGIVDNMNMDFTLRYNGAMTQTYRVLSGSIAANYGFMISNPGFFTDATFFTDQRGADRGLAGDATNSGSFDYIAHLTVRSAYDDANPRTGFDYEIYKPLWDSKELTLREAVLLADDGTDITFKDTWQINGTTYIDPLTGEKITVANELDSSGNLIINLVGGELPVTRSVTIDGMFQWNLVDSNGNITGHYFGGVSQLTAGTNSRVFDVKNAVIGVLSTVSISNFEMDGNGAIVTGNGGGIYAYSNLALTNITVKNCTAIAGASGSDGMGGGIYSEAGYLILNNSLVFNNSGTMGGGIFVAGGKPNIATGYVLDVTGSGITGNTAKNAGATDGKGGGVYVQNGAVHFQYSTIGDNKAVSDGGGIFVATTTNTIANLFLLNSTVANNTAGRNGGGISFYSNSNLNLNFATIANNQSGWTVTGAASGNPYAYGGGIYMNSGILNITNSILAQNYRGSNSGTILVPAVHDDLYLNNSGTNTIDHSVYGTVTSVKAPIPTNSTHVTDWDAFAGKLDTQLLDNGGRLGTVYVFDNAYFQITAANSVQVDQTMLDVWTSRKTVGAYEKINRTFYYIDGEIGKGMFDPVSVSNGGSRWVSGTGVLLTELNGVLNASDATFVIQPGLSKPSTYVLDYTGTLSQTLGYIVATAATPHTTAGTVILKYDWDMKAGWDPGYTTNHGSYLDLGGAANFTVAAGTTAATDVMLGGLISVRDSATLILQSTALTNTRLYVKHVAGVSNTSVYYGKDPVAGNPLSTETSQTVFTIGVDPLTGLSSGVIEYDNLYLYGKDKVGATPAPLYTKNAAGPLHVNGTLVVGDSSDNVKLDVTTAGANPGDLLILGATVHNFGQIAVGNDMTVIGTATIPGKTTIDSGGTITVTRNLTFTDVVVNTQKTITTGGDMAMSNSTITGTNALTVSGNMTMTGGSIITSVGTLSVSGSMTMTGSTINSTPMAVIGDLLMTGSAINGATTVTIGNPTHVSNLEMTSSTITGNATTTAVTATGDILMMTGSAITRAKYIIAIGDLSVTDSAINGGTGTTTVIAGGDAYLAGLTQLTNLTVTLGNGKSIVLGNIAGTTVVTLSNATLGSSSNGLEFIGNSSIVANGGNNQFTSNGLTVSGWTAGTITVNTDASLKINIGSQTLTLTDNTTSSTASSLNLGLDRLIAHTNSRLEIVTTNTVTSSATTVAPFIDGTLALSGIISFGSTNIISLSSIATLELGGTITITKDAVGTAANIVMANSLNIVGNVKVNPAVTGNITITSTAGSIIIGSDVTVGSKFTGNAKNLTISAFSDASVGNITAVKDLTVTATNGNIHLLNSITVTGNILFNGDVKVHLAYTSSARTPASVTPITITAGTAGTITTSGTGYSTFGSDCSELQLSAGSSSANALKNVNLNRSLTLIKGMYTSNGITLTGSTANFLIKGTQAVTVTGNIVLNGGRLDNPVILSVSGDISMLNGTLNNLATGTIKMTGGAGSDVILTGNASFVNAGTFSNASSAITLANGSLTNYKTLTAASIAFSGAGSLSNTAAMNIGGSISLAGGTLTNSKTLTASGSINLAGGSLTNTGTVTLAGDANLTGAASLNNNAGTITANNVSLATGALTNKGILNANSISLGGGNLVNSGTLKERSAGSSIISLAGGGTFTNTGTVTAFDTLTLDSANLVSSTKAFNVTTLNLLGASTKNLTISPLGMTVATLNMTAGNAKMIGGKLTVTGDFNFGSAPLPSQYFQLGNTATTLATLEVRGNVVNSNSTHFFVTLGNNKLWVKPGTVGTSKSFFLSDSPTNYVSQLDIGVSTGTSKMVGISTFTPLTVNGKYNGQHAGFNTVLNSVARVWNITRTTGEFSPLTVKFYWAPVEKGANLNVTNAKLWTIAGASWSLTNPGAGAGFVGNTYETNILRYSGSYSVSAFAPSLAMDDNSSLGAQIDELKEKFIDAIFGTREDIVEQQQVAEAQERAAMENSLSQMASRGNLMERNKLFKTDLDLSLEALLAV